MTLDIDSLWDFGDPAGSETRFREALGALPSDASENDRAELLSQVARTLSLRREFDAAHDVLDSVASMMPVGSRSEVRYMLERGRTLNSSGAPHSALTFFLQALDAAKSLGDDGLAVDAAHMMGIADEPKERLNWNLRAIAMAEASNDPKARKWLASLWNNTGWSLFDEGRFEEALGLFEKARDQRAANGQSEQEAIAKWCVARCLRALGRRDEAFAIQLDLSKTRGDDGYVAEELAELYADSGELEQAAYLAKKAHAFLVADPNHLANDPDRIQRMLALTEQSGSEQNG